MSDDPQNIPAFAGPDGLVTAVAQDAATGQVLMVAHMNREAWDETLASGKAVYFSRARRRLWRKGEESGNIQHVREIFVDCDARHRAIEGRASWRRRVPRGISVLLLSPGHAERFEGRRQASI